MSPSILQANVFFFQWSMSIKSILNSSEEIRYATTTEKHESLIKKIKISVKKIGRKYVTRCQRFGGNTIPQRKVFHIFERNGFSTFV